jgi:hypothetical protein
VRPDPIFVFAGLTGEHCWTPPIAVAVPGFVPC